MRTNPTIGATRENGVTAASPDAGRTRYTAAGRTNATRADVQVGRTDIAPQTAANRVCRDCGGSVWEVYGSVVYYCVYCGAEV